MRREERSRRRRRSQQSTPLGVALASLVAAALSLLPAGFQAVRAASPTDPDRLAAIDAYMTGAAADLGYPGLALVIVAGDRIVHQTTVGKADESGRPVTAQTPFHLASVTKAFTATAILQLVESGAVDLDAPVQRYLPWFTLADPEQASKITVRMLLAQTSGLSTRIGERYVGTDDQDPGAIERAVRDLARVNLDSAPGEVFEYSNANYDTLAAVVQAVAGMPFDAYLQEHIYAPLQMTHSHATREAALADGLAAGYTPWFGMIWRPTDVPTTRAGAGAATTFSSAEDLGHWLIAQLNGGHYGGTSILSEASMALEHRASVAQDDFHAYAMGWSTRPLWEALGLLAPDARPNVQRYEVPALIEHDGNWPNAHAYVGMVPDQHWGFALLVNGNDVREDGRVSIVEQNVLRISQGQEPIAWDGGYLSPVVRYAVAISLVFLVAELVSFAWSIRALRRLRRSVWRGGRRRGLIIGWVVAIALDILVLATFLPLLADRVGLDVVRMARITPDTALLLLPTLALALVWGPIRTVLLGWRIAHASAPGTPYFV